MESSISASLSDVRDRLSVLESSPASVSSDKDEILGQIARTGTDITEANNKVAKEIKDDILKIKDVVMKRLLDENRKLRNKVRNLENATIENE